MEFWHVASDITILLTVAVMFGIIAERLGFSGVVGYLIAGTIVGPGMLDWVSADEQAIHSIAEIGVALLLFTIGLELQRARIIALFGRGFLFGFLQILITGALGFVATKLMGYAADIALVIGGMLALSSTAVVMRVLQDRAETDSGHGRAVFGVLLVQDIAIIPMMIIVAFLGQDVGETIGAQFGITSVRFISLLVIVVLVGVLILPRFFGAALIKRSSEFPVILGIVTCLSAMWLAHQLNFSPSLGAFIAGVILAGSPFAAQVRGDMAPLRYIFLALFFAVTGMLADIPWLFENNHFILVSTLVFLMVVGKTLLIIAIAACLKYPRRIAVASGLCLAQIGEFSFVIGAEAFDKGILQEDTFQLLMSASLISLILTPFLIARARSISNLVDKLFGNQPIIKLDDNTEVLENHVVLIGYGIAGQRIVPDLIQSGKTVVVIDMGNTGVQLANEHGAIGLLGNAQRRDVLEHASIKMAHLCILTLPDCRSAEQTIHQIRACSSSVPIVARARYSRHAQQLELAGADVVVDEEESVGYRVLRQSLKQLGL